ncbi:hypothetical protein JCM19235_1339 [Vibrio maritimus]|uniref:Uncharacterized protein n=1 Tax=Vibrio maritimus TaxID=990268 RepID=A0A090S8D6_9VIBR|nr:hypothetical protein JCM19235_1339 [Vibrio maritimus]
MTASVAAFHAYLWQSFQNTYEFSLEEFESIGGEIDLCLELATVSEFADNALEEEAMRDGLPGVFHYERMDLFAHCVIAHYRARHCFPDEDMVRELIRNDVQTWWKSQPTVKATHDHCEEQNNG